MALLPASAVQDESELWHELMAELRRARSEGDVSAVIALLEAPTTRGKGLSDVRWWAARALGKMGDPQAVEPLVALLRDDDPQIAMTAARGLGWIGDRRAIAPLLEVFGDGDDFIAGVKAVPRMRVLLRRPSEARLDDRIALRQWALDSLGSLRAREILPTLLRLLDHEDHFIRLWAAKLLERVGDPVAVVPLREAERRTPFWRRRLIRRARRRLERRRGSR